MKKTFLYISSFIMLSATIAGASYGISYALYQRGEILGKTESSSFTELNIGSEGAKNVSIYLKYTAWTITSGVNFYMLKWNQTKIEKNESDTTAFKWVKQDASPVTIDSVSYFVFDFDPSFYNRLSFHRVEDTVLTAKSITDLVATGTFAQRYNKDSGGVTSNSTTELTKPKTSNVYEVTSYTSSGSYGFLSSGSWISTILSS